MNHIAIFPKARNSKTISCYGNIYYARDYYNNECNNCSNPFFLHKRTFYSIIISLCFIFL